MQHAKLTEAEYNELCGKRITCSPKDEQGAAGYILRNEKLRRISGCGLVDPEDGESCSYHLNLSYNSTARDGLGGFKVVAFERHDCSKYCSVCPKQPSSAYTSKQLAPLVRAKILTTVQYTPKTVEADLFPAYIKLKPPLSLCKAVLNDAKVMPLDQDTIKMLPAYCAALRTKGHKVKVSARAPLRIRQSVVCSRACTSFLSIVRPSVTEPSPSPFRSTTLNSSR